jgi:hypothetical protein
MKLAIDTVRDKSKSLGNDQTEGQSTGTHLFFRFSIAHPVGAAVWISDHEVKACMVCGMMQLPFNSCLVLNFSCEVHDDQPPPPLQTVRCRGVWRLHNAQEGGMCWNSNVSVIFSYSYF